MASDEEFKALLRATLRHKLMIDILFGVCNDFATMLEPTLLRCEHSRCSAPATVTHVDVKMKMCDYHAAAGIMQARANALKDPTSNLIALRARLADPENWIDLPNADVIRRLDQYVNELRKSNEPEPPVDRTECH